eukprot:4098740-Prymnesium_polylepis.1
MLVVSLSRGRQSASRRARGARVAAAQPAARSPLCPSTLLRPPAALQSRHRCLPAATPPPPLTLPPQPLP